VEGRVGLGVDSQESLEELVCRPIAANYPNCSLTTIERWDDAPVSWESWMASAVLSPELFPILRHAQFEDINRAFADPIDSILRAV
jgi:hypothetical protein